MVVIYAEKSSLAKEIAYALHAGTRKALADEKTVGYYEFKFNGEDAVLCHGVGHLGQLVPAKNYDEKYANWDLDTFPCIPDEFRTGAKPSSIKCLKLVKSFFDKADWIINATDPDREGELIFAYVYGLCKCKAPFKRVWIEDLTEKKIQYAFNNLKEPDEQLSATEKGCALDLQKAGRARDIADWVIGTNLTVCATKKFGTYKQIMALGRVKTPTLNLVVEREKAIANHVKTPYWKLTAVFSSPNEFDAEYEKGNFKDENDANTVLSECQGKNGIVTSLETKHKTENAPLLYNATQLQIAANKKLNWDSEKTMKIMQELYEGKLMSYPRTSSEHLTDAMKDEVKETIEKLLKIPEYSQYNVEKWAEFTKRHFDDSKVGSPPAVIPTVNVPETLDKLTEEQKQLYDLLAKSLIRIIYPKAELDDTTAIITVDGKHNFKAAGSMADADKAFVEGKAEVIRRCGSFENTNDDADWQFAGYDKTKFIINIPGVGSFTERQDIGDGFGGVIDFLSNYSTFEPLIPMLRNAAEYERAVTRLEIPDNNIFIDLKDIDRLEIVNHFSVYEGGTDSEGHELKDNYSAHADKLTVEFTDNRIYITEAKADSDFPPVITEYEANAETVNTVKSIISDFINNGEVINANTYTGNTKETIIVAQSPSFFAERYKDNADIFVLKDKKTNDTLAAGTAQELIEYGHNANLNEYDLKAVVEGVSTNHFDIPVVYTAEDKEAFKESVKENNRCRDLIEHAIADNYSYENHTFDYDKAYSTVSSVYPMERIQLVTAATINAHKGDGRIDESVHKWAEDKINEIPSDIFKRTQLTYLAVNNHCGLVNMFAQEVIAKERQLEQEADKAFEEAVIEEFELDNAKQAITEYFEKENFGTGDFSDLTNIDLAYTTLEGTDIEIQVSADLENTAINTFINGYLFSVEGYDTLEDMTRDALSVMTFDDLISVDSDEVKNFLAKNGMLTQNEEKYSIYQMKTEGKYRHFQSESIDYCKSQNFYPTASDFNLVRTGSLAGIQGDDILEEIRSKHSLDISNVIVIERNGEKTAHYTERRGFQNFPDFFSGQENNIEWTPIAETADDEGHISSYSTKINDRFYRISENPDKRYDIETQYGDTISPVSEECTDFLTRDMAEQYFEENLDIIVNTYNIEFKDEREKVLTEPVEEPVIKGEQLSLFEEETDSKTQHLIDEIMRGTGFEDGKFRMKEYFDENKPNTKDFAQKLKQEYGIGGHSGNGDIRFADHDSKGITIELVTGEKLSYSWNEVAKTLTNLINSDEYITQKDIDERIRHSEYIIKNYNPETADEYDKRQFEKANAILEEYGKNVSENIEQPVTKTDPVNYHIETSNSVDGGPKTKYKANVEAIRTLKTIEAENRLATPEEQDTLAKYIGWGGLANAFDPNKSDWANEYTELKELLTNDEYTSARASTRTAFYTDNMICEEMWKMLADNGFTGGTILEPAVATGNFFGTMPTEMANNSKLYGVELDDVSGRIAKQLYQKADIQITGFENTRFKNESIDVVISNVPFDSTHVIDAEESEMKKNRQKIDGISKSKLTLNDYFIEKSLDKVKPGGIVMVITSKGTLDKKDSFIRQDIAKRADLVGAVRLPNTAFKGNAGTDVTADILILQKRDKAIEITPDWVNKGITEEGFAINQYFVDNPDMVLGKIVPGNKMYGDNDDTSVIAIEGADLKEQLRNAFSKIKLSVNEKADEIIIDNSPVMDIPVDIPAETKPFSYVVDNNKLYFYDNSSMTEFDGPKATGERIKGMTEIRDCLRALISSQLNDDEEGKIQYLQHTLNDIYDKFVSKHGNINDNANLKAFKDDMSLPLLSSLEEIKNGEVVGKASIFKKRTINPKREITSVDTASEALALSISEKAKVDIEYMSQLTGKTAEDLLSDLKGVVYENPQKIDENGNPHLEMSDEYLSGNVREKLKFLKENYADDTRYTLNISSLETVMPKDLNAADIKWQLGNPVIEKDDVNAFMYDLLKTPGYNKKGSYFTSKQIKAEYVDFTATWKITNPHGDPNNLLARNTYGTKRKTAYELIEDCLNQKASVVHDTVIDETGTKKSVINHTETELAQEKQKEIQSAFHEWILNNSAERRDKLVEKYNVRFNSTKPREFDGSFLTFPGMNSEIKLREHQKNAVAHSLYGGNTLFAHEVGAGKTFEIIASAMEGKRLGLHNKSLIAVPNHLTEQIAGDFMKLYPTANILVATASDFEKKKRKKLFAKIATGDFDAVIIGHSQLKKITVSNKKQAELIEKQIQELTECISALKAQGGEAYTVKQLEKIKKELEIKMKALLDAPVRDDLLTFEELGVDKLYLDEAHLCTTRS